MNVQRLVTFLRSILLVGIAAAVFVAVSESIKQDRGCGLCGHVGAAILYVIVPGIILAIIAFIGIVSNKKYPLYLFLLSGIALGSFFIFLLWTLLFNQSMLREGTNVVLYFFKTLFIGFLATFPYLSYQFILRNKSNK